jgi:hypothetical protein
MTHGAAGAEDGLDFLCCEYSAEVGEGGRLDELAMGAVCGGWCDDDAAALFLEVEGTEGREF